MNYFVVFKARSETLKFCSLLTHLKVPNMAVSTPRKISVSCGISAKVSAKALPIVKNVLSHNRFFTFVGVFSDNNSYTKL